VLVRRYTLFISTPGRPPAQRARPYQESVEMALAHHASRTLSDRWRSSGWRSGPHRTSHGHTMLWGAMTSVRSSSPRSRYRALQGSCPNFRDTNPLRRLRADVRRVRRTLETKSERPSHTDRVARPCGPARLLTVVGVLPAEFRFSAGALDFYNTPVALDPLGPRLRHYARALEARRSRSGPRSDESNVLGGAIPCRPPPPLAARLPGRAFLRAGIT